MRRWFWIPGIFVALAVYALLRTMAANLDEAFAIGFALTLIAIAIAVKLLDGPKK